MTTWKNLTRAQKLDLYKRHYQNHEKYTDLATEIGMPVPSLRRNLRDFKILAGINPKASLPSEKPLPANDDLFDILRKGPISLRDISRRFDRSPDTIRKLIEDMKKEGYIIEESRLGIIIDTQKHPKVDYKPAKTLADEAGYDIAFAVASDLQAGSNCCQPSSFNHFIKTAYEEYGVRHVFSPGDITTGIWGYKGHAIDMVPAIRPSEVVSPSMATSFQIWLANMYYPVLPGLKYYILGGNHDYWHIIHSGIDAVAQFCRIRDDAIYLGYDVNDVPLTDRASIRLWHPSGGVPYALSYRLQKGLEQLAFSELSRAVEENDNPKVRFLIAGHLHLEAKFHSGPMIASLAGCFEGQTNYLKRKGLFPQIGGAIYRVRLTESGYIQRVEYTFIPYNEIKDDWMNWPLPPESDLPEAPDMVDVLFTLRGNDLS